MKKVRFRNWGLFMVFGVILHILFHVDLGGVPSGWEWLWSKGGWSCVGAIGCELILWYLTIALFIHAVKNW